MVEFGKHWRSGWIMTLFIYLFIYSLQINIHLCSIQYSSKFHLRSFIDLPYFHLKFYIVNMLFTAQIEKYFHNRSNIPFRCLRNIFQILPTSCELRKRIKEMMVICWIGIWFKILPATDSLYDRSRSGI